MSLNFNKETITERKQLNVYIKLLLIFSVFSFSLFITSPVFATTLLSDDFTGTTIDTSKWIETDPTGIGGTFGDVQQNGSLTIVNSVVGTRALVSVNVFSSTSLEFSATMTAGGKSILGYGDRLYTGVNNKAYLVYYSGTAILGLVWNNNVLVKNTNCGSMTNGATYKMKPISTGFEVYKNGTLACTVTAGAGNLVDAKPVFLESEGTPASTFDDVLITGTIITTDPDAPTDLSAISGDTQATVSFTAPNYNGGSAITSYTVTSSPGSLTTSGATSPLTVISLTNGTTYTFTVTATNAIGTSSASSSSNSVTPNIVLLTDSFTGTTIDTNKWVETDPAGIGGTIGDVQQNGSLTIGGGGRTRALVSIDSFSSTGLEISAVISGAGSPAGQPVLGYGDRIYNGAGNKAYIIYNNGVGGIFGLVWNDTERIIYTSCGTATNGATYKMKPISTGFEVYKNGTLACTITAGAGNLVDAKPVFLESESATSTFDDVLVRGTITIPNAPTIGIATVGNTQTTVSFTAPDYNGGSAITSYTVTSSPESLTTSGATSPLTVTDLTNGVAYTFTVTATNVIGTSIASAVSNEITPHVLTSPEQVVALTVTGVNKQVLLSWTAPTSETTIINYLIEYKTNSSDTWNTFNDGISVNTKTVVTGLTNDTTYDFRVSAVNSAGTGIASALASATPVTITNLVFLINGESNAGGQVHNTDATSEELAPTIEVQILNNTSLVFENLDIGTNNNIDHYGLSGNTTHGFELELADSVKANSFADNPQVHLIKTGQGGSTLSQWNVGGTYWTKFLQRTVAAKTQLATPRQWVVWISLGINDFIAGTTVSNFTSGMIAHINKIKADLPGAIIILTQFQSMTANSGYPTYNTAMTNIATTEANVYVVDSTGATLDDGNHWSYLGLKTVGDRMITITNNALGLVYPGIPTSLSTTINNNQVSLSWTAPIPNGGSSISDYLVEYKLHTDSIWSTFSHATSTNTSATVTNLPDGNYDFRVSAVNSNGVGNSVSENDIIIDYIIPSTPSATPSLGTYNSTQLVTLSATGSDYIKYSLTETPATCSDGTLYSNSTPISIATSQTIYVRACDNAENSSTQSFAYVIAPVVSHSSGGSSLLAIAQFKAAQQPTTPVVTPTPSVPFTPIVLSRIIKLSNTRMWGDDVLALQTLLNTKGYDSGTPDGNFGPKTQSAVIAFQKANGLTPDGAVGPNTVKFMNDSQSTPSIPTSLKTRTLKLSTPRIIGDDVKTLQTYLSANGYDVGTLDGIFGNKTKSAIIAFQTANGLTPDGIVGAKTREMMK